MAAEEMKGLRSPGEESEAIQQPTRMGNYFFPCPRIKGQKKEVVLSEHRGQGHLAGAGDI